MNDVSRQTRSAVASAQQTEVAVLAGGCFWGVGDILRDVPPPEQKSTAERVKARGEASGKWSGQLRRASSPPPPGTARRGTTRTT